MQRRSFQYDNMLFAPDNWNCNVSYIQSGYPDLFAGNKLISLTVSSVGGQALTASIAYFNGVKATPSLINSCIPDITTGQFYLGGYDPAQVSGYASVPAWTIHSLRIYNKVLTPKQIADNSSLDQKRYLSPPVVKIGNKSCDEVIVLSEHFLICKAPSGSIGPADVEVNGFTYTDAYEYVDNNSFYITEFSPILSPVAGGGLLTLT
jgi:hypothetical protein